MRIKLLFIFILISFCSSNAQSVFKANAFVLPVFKSKIYTVNISFEKVFREKYSVQLTTGVSGNNSTKTNYHSESKYIIPEFRYYLYDVKKETNRFSNSFFIGSYGIFRSGTIIPGKDSKINQFSNLDSKTVGLGFMGGDCFEISDKWFTEVFIGIGKGISFNTISYQNNMETEKLSGLLFRIGAKLAVILP